MSQPAAPEPPAGAASRTARQAEATSGHLQSTAQILTFEPGLYEVEMRGAGLPPGDSFSIPCARLDALPSGAGRMIAASLAEGGFLSLHQPFTFIRVLDAATDVLLTIYRSARTAPPELRIRAINGLAARERPAIAPAPEAATPAPELTDLAAMSLTVMVHVEKFGDVEVGPGHWAGAPARDCAIEGFRILTRHDLVNVEMEYQAILGPQWQTPWFRGGEFCGSRGMALSLLGFRVRLIGDSASEFNFQYWGSYAGDKEIGPLSNGDACESDGNPLTAIRMEIAPAQQAELTPTPPATASGWRGGRRKGK